METIFIKWKIIIILNNDKKKFLKNVIRSKLIANLPIGIVVMMIKKKL